MKTNAQLIDEVLELLDLKDKDALEHFLKHGYLGYEVDHVGMTRDDDGYRPLTEAEKKERYAKSLAYRDRMERGEGTPWETLMYHTMNVYVTALTDNIFSPRPLLYHLSDDNDHSL